MTIFPAAALGVLLVLLIGGAIGLSSRKAEFLGHPKGLYILFALLSILSMVLIFILGIQPPNDWALYITIGFLVLAVIIWFVFENRRFQGPPIGDVIAKRQAAIAAAEKAVGET